MTDDVYNAIERIVGPKYLSDNYFELVNNSLDAHPYEFDPIATPIPALVVKPGSEQEISELMEFANREGIPVYPRGSGTSFTGSARAPFEGIILSLSRLRSININEEYGYLECGAGATVDSVDKALAEKGYFLPIYPGSRLVATMGGMMAGNTSGHIIDACIGKPVDYVLALRVVLPTGDIIETGTKGLRKPAGTDLTKLFVGNDGLTGIVTTIRIRLVPQQEKAFGIAYFEQPAAVARAVTRMYREKAPAPLFMEFMDKATTTVGFSHAGLEAPPGCSIFFAAVGNSREIAMANAQILLQVMKKEEPIQARTIENIKEWEKIWTAREVIISSLMQRHDGYFCGPEIVTSLHRLEECVVALENYGQMDPIFRDLPYYLLGHIGALTFHPTLVVPRKWDNEKRKAVVTAGFRVEEEMNLRYDTCGGEWLQFGIRTGFFKKRYGNVSYELVRKLKQLFDPNNILNRGILEGF